MENFDIKFKENNDIGGKEIDIFIAEPQKQKTCIWLKLLTGVIIGFVNGFWGGGGGMICVPLLLYVIKLPEKKAHATTLLIMLPLCISSLIIYIIKGNMLWVEGLEISGGFVVGGVIGALLLKKISNVWLSIVFSVIIIAGGLKLLI
ncbi:MAG: sulfite exporter TauE/SafE family protein [Clostridiales bacterium]|nr:sulfite exporter TauE/SafE family protein [Clostridiales bacterium]